MSISEYNYEAYFLDYHEGKLDAEASRELMDFLERHPELKQEFESFEAVSLNDADEEIKFDNKESLKKSVDGINASTFDEFAVQYVEGTLNSSATAEFIAFVKQHPKFESELALYQKTKLVADNNIVFENKESLKKYSRRRPVAWYYWSAAASAAIIVGAYFSLKTNKFHSSTNIVATRKNIDTTHNNITPIQGNNIAVSPANTLKTNPKNNSSSTNSSLVITKHRARKHNTVVPEIQNMPDNNNVVIKQNNTVIPKQDSVTTPVNKDILATHQQDTNKLNSPVQQPAPVILAVHTDSLPHKKSILTFASAAIKTIGSIIKHGIGIKGYYSKETDKLIAYQVTLGDNRYTIPLRFSSN
jgi:hypothetical protein